MKKIISKKKALSNVIYLKGLILRWILRRCAIRVRNRRNCLRNLPKVGLAIGGIKYQVSAIRKSVTIRNKGIYKRGRFIIF